MLWVAKQVSCAYGGTKQECECSRLASAGCNMALLFLGKNEKREVRF